MLKFYFIFFKDSTKYVELLEASRTAGSIYCKFQQKIIPEGEMEAPNLNQTFYFLLAYGTTSNYEGKINYFHLTISVFKKPDIGICCLKNQKCFGMCLK